MRKYFCIVFCFLCTFACTDHYDAPSDKDVHLDTKLALNNIMTYINHNDKSMGYLTERNYSAVDVKSKFARYRVSGDSLWIFVPIVRYLCDSTTTVDSMRLQPKRTYALSFFKGNTTPCELWFVEDSPTTEYHYDHEMAMWYNNLTGRRRYFNEEGKLVSSKNLNEELNAQLSRFGEADSADNWEIELPEVEVTAPHVNRGGYWGDLFSPWGSIPSGDSYGGTDLGGYVTDVGGGSSEEDKKGKEKRPKEPVLDCKDTLMQRNKQTLQELCNKLTQTEEFTYGRENLHKFSAFIDKVKSNRKIEWGTVLRDIPPGIGVGIADINTDNLPNKCQIDLLEKDLAARALIHNHPNGSPLSAKDIMTLLSNMDGHPNLNTIMAWDDITNTYYCATINDRKKAAEFYDKHKNEIDENTNFWKNESTNPIGIFLKQEQTSFKSYKKDIVDLYSLISVLAFFDSGISIVKIENKTNTSGNVKTQVIPMGAYKKENSKYINIKLCRE